jgi:hypothetical protein
MRDSERYDAQADAVFRLAARSENPAERQVYLSIAEGWRKLAAEAARNERRARRPPEPRSFDHPLDD